MSAKHTPSVFAQVICKNIDQLADAAHWSQGDQAYVDQHLDMFSAFSERIQGRSGLASRAAISKATGAE